MGDIAHLRTAEGWLNLATAIDLRAHVMVECSLSDRMTGDIVVVAPESAKSHGYVPGNVMFYSDGAFAEWTRTNDARLSCNRTGNCHDNAVAESFFATLKNTDNGNRAIDEGYRRKCA